MIITREWLEEEKMFRSGKFYRPGGPNGVEFPRDLLTESLTNNDLQLYRDLVLTFLVPRNPRLRRHLEILAGFSVSEVLRGSATLEKQHQGLVAGYRQILAAQLDGSGKREPIEYSDIDEIYTWNVLPLAFLPADCLELFQAMELDDEYRKNPDFERQSRRRTLETVERVLGITKDSATGSPVSEADESALFETKLMECYPDYYSVLLDMGWVASEIASDVNLLPEALREAYNRATLRTELRLKSERFRSKKKEDVAYALEVIDKKYKDKAQPFFVPTKTDQLPPWLSAEMLGVLAGHLTSSSPQKTRKVLDQPAQKPKKKTAPASEPLETE